MGTSQSQNQRFEPASDDELYQPVNSVGDVENKDSLSNSLLRKAEKIDGMSLSWREVCYSVPDGNNGEKEILHKCSGHVDSGELCCIMGPSGAGKTTLMNLLAGRVNKEWTGLVTANERSIDPRSFSRNIAYVMQEEALFATATPREALHFSAAMRLPQSTTVASRTRLVNSLLNDLDLNKCADTLIGSVLIKGISGGEKKRTSIGVELITQPKIIFLDEPTSGLDTFSAYNVVKILRKLCAKGCSVLCTIHQPSSEIFHLFNKTILIESGYIIYQGPVQEVPNYFASLGEDFKCPKNYNPADHVMFLMQEKDATKNQHVIMRNAWREEEKKQAEKAPAMIDRQISRQSSQYQVTYDTKAGIFRQFQYLMAREFRNTARDKKTLCARFFLTTFLHTLYGLVFKGVGKTGDLHSRYGALLQLTISAMFGCAQPMILTFPFERPVFIREYISGAYYVFPYFFSKAMTEIPLAMCQTLIGLTLGYTLMELQGNFLELWMGLFLLGIVASSISIALGCATTNVKTAMETTPLIFVPQMLFAGFFVPISSIPVYLRWSQWLCTLKYSINIMLLTEFTEDTPEVNYLLESNSVKRSALWFYVGMLVVLFFVFRIIGMVALAARSRSMG